MARFYPSSGGGGADTSVVTAAAGNVLSGKVIVDAEGNPLTGTMPDNSAVGSGSSTAVGINAEWPNVPTRLGDNMQYTTDVNGTKRISIGVPEGYYPGEKKAYVNRPASDFGTADASQVLNGQSFTSANGLNINGTMPNNGAVAPSALAAGGSYTIPAGYHNGSGKVTVQSLATMTASGDATAAQILTGKKAYVDGSLITGTMADQGAKTSSLNCGGSYTIPAGYHNGSGKITANSLSSQTSATATAAQIASGKTAWVNGSKLTGTLVTNSAINFSAAALSATSIRISWTNPSKGPWTGVFIQMSTSGNPGSSGGTRIYTGKGANAAAGGSNYTDITGLTFGTTYYFTCTSYVDNVGWGSSYNVNAKTGDLVLWDGSSYQNGATYATQNLKTIDYTHSGPLTGRSIVFKPKKSYFGASQIITFADGQARGNLYMRPDGTTSTGLARNDWLSSNEYVLPLNSIVESKYLSTFNRFRFFPKGTELGDIETTPTNLDFTAWIAYIKLR